MSNHHDSSLDIFHPLIGRWFQNRVGRPTTVQQEGWSKIAAGEHVLLTAPTGSGKTLTAFLWALNQLILQQWPAGCTRVLYISPLKALNNDIRRNLLTPLSELKSLFDSRQCYWPAITVKTRSGDTPQSDRRRMLRHPPEILITTPESLNLLLSSKGGRTLLGGITTVIMDEIHAVVENKRGVHLISAVDRMVRLCGEFQRIALSATVKPLSTVSQFVGGYKLSGSIAAPSYIPRPVTVIHSRAPKKYRMAVRFPEAATLRSPGESIWKPLTHEFNNIIDRNTATLLFTNSRRLCEKLTLIINRRTSKTIAYAHHGSLSRQIREEVEARLKSGDLKAIIATNSLELGIDIGELDEVILIQSPPSISSAVQRVGRAGHRIGRVSRGTLFPTHGHDLLEAAVLCAAIPAGDIEKIAPVQCPLDVLAQIVISMVGVETWDRDALYAWIKTSHPYRKLCRAHYDLVLNMLAGRYAESRIRELKPRISIDGLDNTVAARPGALLALYTSGGVIPDRGYFNLRHARTNSRIGELDEEFVWEARIGQAFALGTQYWKIVRITHNDVFVTQASPTAMAAPFWKGERRRRDYHFSRRLAQFLEIAQHHLDTPDFIEMLKSHHFMDEIAAKELVVFLKRQREHTGCALPHRHHLIVEYISSGPGSVPGHQVVFHTLWGGRLNHPFALAFAAAWEKKFGRTIEVYADNDCISVMLPHEESPEDLFGLVTSAHLKELLQQQLEGSGFFAARFRECAGRALLLTRSKVKERVPLWMSRLRSQKLHEAVSRFQDFPILLESWRTCIQDEFDLENLHKMLTEIAAGVISLTGVRTSSASPMAQGMAWRQINHYMYKGDETPPHKGSSLSGDLLKQVLFAPELRPAVPGKIVSQFEQKRKRLAPGYTPTTSRDLLDWVKERLLIPMPEWRLLQDAMERDLDAKAQAVIIPAAPKLRQITPNDAAQPLIVALENLTTVIAAFYGKSAMVEHQPVLQTPIRLPSQAQPSVTTPKDDLPDPDQALIIHLGNWLQFYGPISEQQISETLGIRTDKLCPALESLLQDRKVITGRLVENGDPNDFCDSENYAILLRMQRSEASAAIDPLPLEQLQLYLAAYQNIVRSGSEKQSINKILDQLLCCPVKADLWETELLPARIPSYRMEKLDRTIQETDLMWIGGNKKEVLFCFESDLDLVRKENMERSPDALQSETTPDTNYRLYRELFNDPAGRYHFTALGRRTRYTAAELSNLLWEGVWERIVTNDSMAALRQGLAKRFKAPVKTFQFRPASDRQRRTARRIGNRRAFDQWKQAHNLPGNWFLVPYPDSVDDPLERQERSKARVRMLLDRYGLLFRELLLRELPQFQWASLFRSLRIMELSGEVITGCFFHDIPGIQFMSPNGLQFLQARMPPDSVYWFNAKDPASLCGIQIDGLRGTLPPRRSSTHLVYRGARQIMVCRQYGKTLTFHVPPDDPDIISYLGPLHHLLTRRVEPLRHITVETINGQPAASSPYLEVLRLTFEVVADYKTVTLYQKHGDG
jgi:ATP-dependent Lhr-like helicase